jgi:alanyl-tRNA synthetase
LIGGFFFIEPHPVTGYYMPMTTDDLREKYLAFFAKHGHTRLPSARLVPENDPTTLFTGSGMQPMVPYLLGQKHPQGTRLTDSQKCLRVQDIEDVGDNRHTTFFEMLGNWSLGDYFKTEQIRWMFDFLTRELGLDPKRIYITAFRGNDALGIPRDEETVGLWQELFSAAGIDAQAVDNAAEAGMQGGRIFYYDETKNWWSRSGVPANMPVGEPGGPDTEMFWDYGEQLGLHEKSSFKDWPCHVNCDCGRFMEIGNNVFMEYVKTADGFETLPQKNVDFGGGLERISAAVLDNPDVFLIDAFTPLRQQLETLSGIPYGQDSTKTKAFRVIMDHLRAVTFLIGDDVLPSNKDQGYFTRRLLRRAIRFADTLGITQQSCTTLCAKVIESYASAYPALQEKRDAILSEVDKEEAKFRRTLAAGLRQFKQLAGSKEAGGSVSAQEAFDLYQSYGFPLELTQELAQEANLSVDSLGFKNIFTEHQNKSRAGAEQKFKGGLGDHSAKSIQYHTATHLLHQALRDVLGSHVFQKGSNITPERLRFDFSHPDKMTPEQIRKVEEIINQKIQEDLPVVREEMTVEEGKKKGALGLFEHKYGEKVSVYSVGDYSREMCGGPHVTHTAELQGTFKILKEEAVSAGVRRIKAVLE